MNDRLKGVRKYLKLSKEDFLQLVLLRQLYIQAFLSGIDHYNKRFESNELREVFTGLENGLSAHLLVKGWTRTKINRVLRQLNKVLKNNNKKQRRTK